MQRTFFIDNQVCKECFTARPIPIGSSLLGSAVTNRAYPRFTDKHSKRTIQHQIIAVNLIAIIVFCFIVYYLLSNHSFLGRRPRLLLQGVNGYYFDCRCAHPVISLISIGPFTKTLVFSENNTNQTRANYKSLRAKHRSSRAKHLDSKASTGRGLYHLESSSPVCLLTTFTYRLSSPQAARDETSGSRGVNLFSKFTSVRPMG